MIAMLFEFQSLRGQLLGLQSLTPGQLSSLFLATVLTKLALDVVRFRLRGQLAGDFVHHIRIQAFQQYCRTDAQWHEARDAGRRLLRFSGDTSSLKRLLIQGVLQYAADCCLIMLGLGVIARIDGRLAAALFAALLVAAICGHFLHRHMRRIDAQQRSKKSGLLAYVNTTLIHLTAIQALNRVVRNEQRFVHKAEKLRTLEDRYDKIAALQQALPFFLVQMLLACVLYYSWQGRAEGASLLVAVLILMSWRNPLMRFLKAGLIREKGLLTLEKFDALQRIPVEAGGREDLRKQRNCILHLQDVSFAYGKNVVLKNFTLKLETARAIGLVMPVGAGKTTLVKLLAGLYNPMSGVITWNGQPAEQIGLRSIRRQMAFVSDAFPLTGRDLLDAISNSSKSDALRTAEAAFADFQQVFPDALAGIDIRQPIHGTMSSLSAGQQRLLQCLRAILADKPVLILDNPFTGLDVETSRLLSAYFQNSMTNKAVLLLSSIPELPAWVTSSNYTFSVGHQ